MAETYYFIEDLINDLKRGRIRIPSFQRSFVWDPDRVLYLMDSIYKGFPFGSILLWRTRNPLRTERNLGPYKLPNNDPEYPIDYVLDGQQRITSIFGIFQNTLEPNENEETDWINLFYIINSNESIPFIHLEDWKNYDKNKYFPLRYVFDSLQYRKVTRGVPEDIAEKIDSLVNKFTKARIPIERFENEQRKYVATVFERVNKQGIELNTFQLLSVWNWSDDFDLQEKFAKISEELEDFGFKQVGSDLILKCSSAIVNKSSNPESFMELPGNKVSQKFDEIKTGIFRAIDFLKTELNIYSLNLLPMENILVVLATFFTSCQKQPPPIPQQDYDIIKKWFWRSCFTKRYAISGVKNTDKDISEILKLKEGNTNNLADFSCNIESHFFENNKFNMGSVATKSFVLMLAQKQPLSFIQGTKVSLEKVLSQGNRNEFHHIFPKSYLKNLERYGDNQINCLANFAIIARTDNQKISNKSPSEYQSLMTNDQTKLQNILSTHFCDLTMFEDDYNQFLQNRSQALLEFARKLYQ